MTTYTEVYGSDTVPPSEYGYQALSISANTTVVWPYNSSGGTSLSKIINLTATAAGLVITLPDARQVSTGEDFLIRNVGAESVVFNDAGGTPVATVTVGAASYFYLTSNSTEAGTYGVIAYGVGTSSVDAASLVGYGIIASGATLNQAHPVLSSGTPVTIDAPHRATVFNYTGGTETLPLTAVATLGDNFFFLLRNSGTGTLTIAPNAAETIDGALTLDIQPGESILAFCGGDAWYSVGYGRSIIYNFTQLVKDLSGGGTFTLTSSEASNKLLTFIGNPAASVTVVVPDVVAVYYLLNSLSTAVSVTVETALGTGVTLAQSARLIAISDATNVYSAQSVAATSSVSLVNGSAAAPSLNFATQTNTGLYKYGATGMGITTNGTAQITMDGAVTTISAASTVLSGTLTAGNSTLGNVVLGTVTSGAWNGTKIGAAYGGTNWDSSAVTGIPKVAAGVWGTAAAGTDYQAPIGTIVGIAKGNGANALTAATANTDYLVPALANTAVTGFKTATFNSQTTIATTTGAITVDWTSAQNQKQTEPTGNITYTFTAPPGPCHLQLVIDSDGTSTARTFTWPGTVIWMGSTWTASNNKKAIINFWYDGSSYFAMGTNQV